MLHQENGNRVFRERIIFALLGCIVGLVGTITTMKISQNDVMTKESYNVQHQINELRHKIERCQELLNITKE